MPHADPLERKRYQAARYQKNRAEMNASVNAWKKANPEKFKARSKAYAKKARVWESQRNKGYQRKYLYGLGPGEFQARLESQNNCCAGCGTNISEKTAHVDHCHKTNNVRGLLCRRCNLALGHTNDDPEILRRLAAYLEKSYRMRPTPPMQLFGFHHHKRGLVDMKPRVLVD